MMTIMLSKRNRLCKQRNSKSRMWIDTVLIHRIESNCGVIVVLMVIELGKYMANIQRKFLIKYGLF